MKSSIVLKLITWVVAVIGIVAFVIGPNDGVDKNKDLMVTYALVILAITATITVLYSLINILKRPAVLKKALLSLAVLAVILVIAYVLASNSAVFNSAGKQLIGEGSTSKWVSTGIIYSIILLGIGSVLFLLDMVRNIVK